jgi:hypothetical protein
VREWGDDLVRGGGVGCMLIVALCSLWLFIEGGLISRGVFTTDEPGALLQVAGLAGIVASLVVMQGLIVGAAPRVVGAALAQGLTALLVVWMTLEHRAQRDDSDEIRLVALAVVLLVDAILIVWGTWVLKSPRRRADA